MKNKQESLNALQDIRNMMEQSSRFISLSGLSGVAAGTCALVGAFFARAAIINAYSSKEAIERGIQLPDAIQNLHQLSGLQFQLLLIAALTFIAAFVSATLLTYARSKKQNIPIWGKTARRLMYNVGVPLLVGGLFCYKILSMGYAGIVAPACLVFFGIALFSAGKYTLPEIKYLGYCEMVLGLLNLFFIGYGLYFWAVGFGVLTIGYGIYMWWKYERVQ